MTRSDVKVQPFIGTFSLRKATGDDAPVLRALAHVIWNECYADILTIAQIEYMIPMMYGDAIVKREIEQNRQWDMLVCTQDNKTVGYCSYGIEPNKDNDTGKTVKLHKIYMLAEYRGGGGAKLMFDAVERYAYAHECDTILLTVNKHNLRAQKAYLKAGYVNSDSLVTDIGNGFVMDDYVFTRTINKTV